MLLLEKTALNQTKLHEEGDEGVAWSHLYVMINVQIRHSGQTLGSSSTNQSLCLNVSGQSVVL